MRKGFAPYHAARSLLSECSRLLKDLLNQTRVSSVVHSGMGLDARHEIHEGLPAGALADGVHLPLAAVAVDLGHDHRRVVAVAAQVVAGEFLLVRAVDDAAEGVLDLLEGLAGEAVHHEDEAADHRWYSGELNDDLLVVAIAGAGAVVTGVADAAVL